MNDHDTILIPTDGSPGAQTAVDHGLSLARAFDAVVHILYVVDTRMDTQADVEETVWTELEAAGEEIVAEIAEQATETGLDATTAVRRGAPHEEIGTYADEHAIGLIVMGTRGASATAPLGSVTEKVLRHTHRPVVTVPRDD